MRLSYTFWNDLFHIYVSLNVSTALKIRSIYTLILEIISSKSILLLFLMLLHLLYKLCTFLVFHELADFYDRVLHHLFFDILTSSVFVSFLNPILWNKISKLVFRVFRLFIFHSNLKNPIVFSYI